MTLALDDITVLDLSHALAGPFASTVLGDFGASVIKIETPGTGDIARAWGPPFYGNDSAYFVQLNRNKKSVEIDLKHPEGKELFFKLLEKSDVLVENFRVGTVQGLGVDYAQARGRNPRIIYCAIKGVLDGPSSSRPYLDELAQMEGGLAYVTGLPGLSMRFGSSKEGLPINVQLVGSWLAESTILHLALLLESVSPVRDLHPNI